jgi:hypothetical protein
MGTMVRRDEGNAGRGKVRVAWLFDVDGVLTDPERKVVTRPALFDELARRLRAGEPVGLNTGRSLEFVVERILEPLEAHVGERALLHRVIAIGEKGGAWVNYDADGVVEEQVDPDLAVPAELQVAVRTLVARPPYDELMFYDETKRTMISTELRDGMSVAEFTPLQVRLVAEMRELLARRGLTERFQIDPNRIATDIQHQHVGKALGAQRFVELLEGRSEVPERYICFGDSASDYEMLTGLLALGKRAELVFVGERELLSGKDARFVTFSELMCDEGTLEYLRGR